MVLGLRQKLGISVFIGIAPAAKLLSWQQPLGCHFVSFVMHISTSKGNALGTRLMHICGAKCQEHYLNSFRVIVYLVFYHF